jgi:RNA polymerase sigma-70 factor (ECF subfamily)
MFGRESANRVRRSPAEEHRLVEAAQRDLSRFADLYEHYFEIVYAYVARRVRSRAEAEDLTADVFHRALRSLPRFKWTGAPFASWLFRIASNLIADRARREGRESTGSFESISWDERSSSDLIDFRSSDTGARTVSTDQRVLQDELEASERRVQLFLLLNELGDDQRRVLMLRFVEEMSVQEIAVELGRTEGAIRQLQFRALKNLRAKLAGEPVTEV